MTTARAMSIGFVGNIVTNPFGKVSDHLADATCAHFPIGQIEQVLAGPASVDVLTVHLDHRWFFDVAPATGAVARIRALAELVSARIRRGPGTVILNTMPFVPASSVESAGALAILGFANMFRERNQLSGIEFAHAARMAVQRNVAFALV